MELVVLIEIAHPLPEECAGQRDVLVGPRVERVEALDVAVVPQVPPEVHVGRQVGGRPDELEAGADRGRGDRSAEPLDDTIDIEVFRIEPDARALSALFALRFGPREECTQAALPLLSSKDDDWTFSGTYLFQNRIGSVT